MKLRPESFGQTWAYWLVTLDYHAKICLTVNCLLTGCSLISSSCMKDPGGWLLFHKLLGVHIVILGFEILIFDIFRGSLCT